MSKQIKVEVALLYEDHTWDTEVVEVSKSDDETHEDAVARWFSEEATQQACYRKVVQACLYNIPNEGEYEDDEDE
jgi:hypothetical protein